MTLQGKSYEYPMYSGCVWPIFAGFDCASCPHCAGAIHYPQQWAQLTWWELYRWARCCPRMFYFASCIIYLSAVRWRYMLPHETCKLLFEHSDVITLIHVMDCSVMILLLWLSRGLMCMWSVLIGLSSVYWATRRTTGLMPTYSCLVPNWMASVVNPG